MSDQSEANQDGTGNNGAAADQPGGARQDGQDDQNDEVGQVGLQRKVATLEAERNEAKDRMLRIAAEFENWKKRSRKEQEDGEAKIRESVLKDMLDVMDNLERAVGAYGGGPSTGKQGDGKGKAVDGAAILQGVGLVLRLFQSKLERYGVKAIEAQGQPFDPRLHEAISRTETTTVAPGSVATEMQRGYRIGDRLLRPSMVSVAAAPAGQGGGGGVGDNDS